MINELPDIWKWVVRFRRYYYQNVLVIRFYNEDNFVKFLVSLEEIVYSCVSELLTQTIEIQLQVQVIDSIVNEMK